MTLLDSSGLEERIYELELLVSELQKAVCSHELAIDSLINASESMGINLRELREEIIGRVERLEGKLYRSTVFWTSLTINLSGLTH